jgi:hypothetical protein
VRLKERWADEHEAWTKRPLGAHQYAYIWADGSISGWAARGTRRLS